MRRLRPIAAASVLAFAFAGTLVVIAGGGAGALPRAGLVVADGADTVATYGPVAGNNPSSQEVDPIPSDCADPSEDPLALPVFFAACDVIPIKVVPPAVTESDDYFLEIGLTWAPADQEEEVLGVAVNDLDMYLYDNQQVAQREDPESATYTQVGKSAGSVQPEKIRIFRPELGDYNLVVNNFSGPNTDYTITARIVIGLFESPFEALAPNFSAGDDETPSDESAAPPMDFSADLPTPSASSPSNPFDGTFGFSPVPTPVDLGEVAVLPDSDFDDFAEGSDFENQLNRQPALDAASAAFRPPPPPKPVAAIVLLFWLLLVPLALAAAAWFFVVKRRTNLNFA